MDNRAAKLAAARQKLKHHQENKMKHAQKEMENSSTKDVSKSFKSLDKIDSDHNKVQQHSGEIKENTVSIAEILLENNTKLEARIKDLEFQLFQVNSNYTSAIEQQNISMHQVSTLQAELQSIQNQYQTVLETIVSRDKTVTEIQNKNSMLIDENNNLHEQIELTKSILTVKETENSQLINQIQLLQGKLDSTQLQVKQLTNDSSITLNLDKEENLQMANLIQKNSYLEQQLKSVQKDRDQINSHYEHYVHDLSTQLKAMGMKNDELAQELDHLYLRENNLIDQISEMEKRLQNYSTSSDLEENNYINILKVKLEKLEEEYQELKIANDHLQAKCKENQSTIEVLSQRENFKCHHDDISISKLNDDITSDKVAAQRATEQNKKLKTDLKELEHAFVKMSQDKLELTEKLTHEKYLNRELTLKLAEVEENLKSIYNKLMAKDEEMIRIQNTYRLLEQNYEALLKIQHEANDKEMMNKNLEHIDIKSTKNDITDENIPGNKELQGINFNKANPNLPKEDAMVKLQERFLNIMDEVANLSDEKHRLEHIILQLQNETDTICEYVALYQQQRSLLKKKDEERNEQIKMFENESEKLKKQLRELNGLLLRFANDKELSFYLQDESRKEDLRKVMELLSNLENSLFITSKHRNSDFKNFYPCNCSAGQLIEV